MGLFVNENTLNGYSYNSVYHTDLYSPSDYTIYDEGVDINYTTLGYEIVAESQQEWNTLMKQVALNELAVYSSNGCREVLYEATSFSAVFNKIKEFFKKLAEKVKAIFHSFMAKMSSVFGKSSSFAKKYGQDFINKVQNIRDDFEFKGYTFTIKEFSNREETMFDGKIANIYKTKANTLAYILEPIVKGLKADPADAEKASQGVYEWLKSVDVPNKLKDEGFTEEDVKTLTDLAFTTPSLDGLLSIAPTEATKEAVETIYRESL